MNNGIIKKIFREKDLRNIQDKLNKLGNSKKMSAVEFLSLRIITLIMLAIILILFKVKYYIIIFTLVAYYNLFYYIFITQPLIKRTKKLDREALTFFEILTLTLESGRNLENSLEITCYNIDSELSGEFKRCLMEVKFGKSFMEALEDLKLRIPSDTINNIILNIKETSIFGNSIVDVMNNQVDFLREKQIMEVKSLINKIPNKVSIVSVLFVVPLILLIILGPFIISLLG